jgi:hypothetical protein
MLCIAYPWEGIYVKNRIFFLLSLLLLAAGFGCSDDCPVCSKDEPAVEKEYHLVYSYGADYWVYTYSTKSLKAVDSVRYSSNPFEALEFTKDGKYACYSKPGATWVTDYATGDTIAIDHNRGGYWLSLSKDDQMLLLSAGANAAVFRVPDLTVLYSVPVGTLVNVSCFDPIKNVAYVIVEREDSLLIVGFDSTGIHDHKIGLAGIDGTLRIGASVAVTLDGSILLLLATDAYGNRFLQLRDTDSLGLITEYYPGHGGPYIHPDGRRVFLLHTGTSDNPEPWAIYVLDLKTLIMKRVVDGDDYTAFGGWPYTQLHQIDFTPDGRYGFIRGGYGIGGSPPILKLDLDTYEIVDAIYPQYGISRAMRIHPLEIKGGN